jgi:digalactosyldiacylglycerol synthase
MKYRRRPQCRGRFLSILLLISFLAVASRADNDEETAPLPDHDTTTENEDEPSSKTSNSVISLAESIRKSQNQFQRDRSDKMKNYWKRTFAEIENLDVLIPETAPLLNQWKLLLDDDTTNATAAMIANVPVPPELAAARSRPRFDGFRSWDRLLQEWTEDVADYIERNTVESQSYPMSTFGKPATDAEDGSTVEAVAVKEEVGEVTMEAKVVVPEAAIAPPQLAVMTETATRENPADDNMENKPKQLPGPRVVKPGEEVLPHTDISDKSKSIWIVTTASLPWMTGTAVNPLLRAAYMTQGRHEVGGKVTLMLPWLEQPKDQQHIYNKIFDKPEDQEEYVRTWLIESANMKEECDDLNIAWYPARQEPLENSIYSMGDITALIPVSWLWGLCSQSFMFVDFDFADPCCSIDICPKKTEDVDICILEEPEHLNWYRAPGENWTTKFKHVVGIVHTNYFVYAQEQPAAFIRAPAMRLLCSWMCRAHCHRLIKLSGTLGNFAPEKELVENVHGVRGTFLDIGEDVRKLLVSSEAESHPVFAPDAQPTVYFIGKMLWSKGLGSLMELLKYAEESADLKMHVDMYGGGPDKDAADGKCKKLGIDMEFHGPVDHSKLAMTHKIFVNPSTSEVLCTTTSEALAMGKFVVLPSHPSNDFFAQFPNCLPYSNKEEFVGNLYYALTHSPAPLTTEYAYALSWAAATERLEAAGSISVEEAEMMSEVVLSQETGVEVCNIEHLCTGNFCSSYFLHFRFTDRSPTFD